LAGLASEIAYNAMLSFFPAILSLLAAISFFDLFRPALRRFASQFAEVAPLDVVNLTRNFVNNGGGQGVFTLSFLFTLWVSSNAMAAAMTALDQIQQVPFRDRRPFWHVRLVAICLTLGNLLFYILAAFLVFVSDFLIRYFAAQAGPGGTRLLAFWWVVNWPIALGLVALAVTCLYRFGPSCRQPHMPILPGALLAALSWAGISFLFRTYILQFGRYSQVYGTLGTAIILMLWLYLSAWAVLIGYQFNVTIQQKRDRALGAAALNALNPKFPEPNPPEPPPPGPELPLERSTIEQSLSNPVKPSPQDSSSDPWASSDTTPIPPEKVNYRPTDETRKATPKSIPLNPKPTS
jgi:membrane protein